MNIAIQPDLTLHQNGEKQSFSDRWAFLCEERGWPYQMVNVYSSHFIQSIKGFDGFFWRPGPSPQERDYIKRLSPLLESMTDMVIYPSTRTLMSDSKLDQHQLFQLLDIPTPNTVVFRNREEALSTLPKLEYPCVLKLDIGYQSKNVVRINNAKDAEYIAKLVFQQGIDALFATQGDFHRPGILRYFWKQRMIPSAKTLLGYPYDKVVWGGKKNLGYLYIQQYLPENSFDTRVAVIGERAFTFRRMNRDDDFRASGSGKFLYDPSLIDERIVRLAFDISDRMGTQSNAMDFLYRDGEPVLLECNLSFATWPIRNCPGYWFRESSNGRVNISWHEGSYLAEDAIFDVLAAEINTRKNALSAQG